MRAVVVGAGIGGLAAAIALRRTGWDVTVLERAPELEPLGAGITMWPNALRALQALGIDIEPVSVPAGEGAGLRNPSGRIVAASEGVQLRALHRGDLQNALLSALPDGTVRTGCPVSKVAGDSVMTGDEAISADLIVAADGLNSTVRGQLWPSVQPRYCGYTAWRGVTARHTITLTDPGDAGETWGSGLRFGIVALPESRVYWYGAANAPAGERFPEEHAEVVRRFGAWHRPIPEILAATVPAEVLHHDIYDLPALPTYVHGRVVLLGDAAHAMTPDLGQGGCQALEDAVVLAACLADADEVGAGLARYDAERRPRTQSLAKLARRIGKFAQASGVLGSVRMAAMRFIPERATARQIEQVTRWDPPQLG